MSWQACGIVKKLHSTDEVPLTRLEKFVLLTLADSYNDDLGYAFPSLPKLAEWTMISVRHLVRVLNSLENKGFLVVKRFLSKDKHLPIRGKPNRYQIVGVDGVTACQANSHDTHASNSMTNRPNDACHQPVKRAFKARSLQPGEAAPLTGAPPAEQPPIEDEATRQAREEFRRAFEKMRDQPSQ